MAQRKQTREALRQAHAEAARTASRAGLLSAVGFGVALVMGANLARMGTLLAPGFGLESLLLVGGLGGGIWFTVLALRASAMARRCREQLERSS